MPLTSGVFVSTAGVLSRGRPRPHSYLCAFKGTALPAFTLGVPVLFCLPEGGHSDMKCPSVHRPAHRLGGVSLLDRPHIWAAWVLPWLRILPGSFFDETSIPAVNLQTLYNL